jgi:hypothetical protein
MAKKRIDMGHYMATSEEREDIEINSRKNRSPYLYKKVQIWEEIFKFYKYYYNKYGKNTI